MKPTPGIRYIGRVIVAVVAPCTALLLLAYRFGVLRMILPVWQTLLLLAAAPLLVIFLAVSYDTLSQHRRETAFGARLAPHAKGRWIGDVDILKVLNAELENDYMGSYFLELGNQSGRSLTFVFCGKTSSLPGSRAT